MRVFLIIVATVALLGYAGACWFLHARQRDLIYYGAYTRADIADTDFTLRRPGAVLRGWVVHPGGRDPILYFGGNAERIEHNRETFARLFPERSVYLVAYRGYGASDGAPEESLLVADALALFDEVRARHPGQRIAVIGRSLGSGVASQVAARRPVERLALVTPFDSMVGAAQAHYPWFPVDTLLQERYESARALRRFAKPVLIVRGGRDEVVPPASTLRLIATLPGTPEVVAIDTADHNDIAAFPEYATALARFLR